MARGKQLKDSRSSRPSIPALTPEAQENACISLAMSLAEQQLRDGTASSQVITHYLKLGSSRERLERERLEMEKELTAAKIKNLDSNTHMDELYAKALRAFSDYRYNGNSDEDEEQELR